MTIDEARGMLDRPEHERQVAYQMPGVRGSQDHGVVAAVTDRFVFVRYGTNLTAIATRPEDLTAVP